MDFPKFFVGVWAQPVESFAKWKAEGVNLVIHPDINGATTPTQRRKVCADLGLFYIDMTDSVADTQAMVNDPWCYGVMYPDEPIAPWFSSDPAGFKAAVDAWNNHWTPILQPAVGKKAIFINFAGGNVTAGRPWNLGQNQIPFATLATDICGDWYPIATNFDRYWDKWNDGTNLPVSLVQGQAHDALSVGTTLPQYMVRCLKLYLPQKTYFSYVETCQFDAVGNTAGRQITAADFNAEVASLLKEGLRGIIYFTHNFRGEGWNPSGAAGHTDWDGRQPDVAAACKAWALSMTGGTVVVPPPPPPVDLITPRVTALESKETALEARVSALEAKLGKIKTDL